MLLDLLIRVAVALPLVCLCVAGLLFIAKHRAIFADLEPRAPAAPPASRATLSGKTRFWRTPPWIRPAWIPTHAPHVELEAKLSGGGLPHPQIIPTEEPPTTDLQILGTAHISPLIQLVHVRFGAQQLLLATYQGHIQTLHSTQLTLPISDKDVTSTCAR